MFVRSQYSDGVKILVGAEEISTPCEEIKDLENGLEIVDLLREALSKSPTTGIGLAANQIGIPKKVFILNIPYANHFFGYAFINPQISNLREPIVFNEGCLSFPGENLETLRYNKIHIQDDLDPEGKEVEGLMAVAAQHEAAHLDGLTMYDSQFSKIKHDERCRCGSKENFSECCWTAFQESK